MPETEVETCFFQVKTTADVSGNSGTTWDPAPLFCNSSFIPFISLINSVITKSYFPEIHNLYPFIHPSIQCLLSTYSSASSDAQATASVYLAKQLQPPTHMTSPLEPQAPSRRAAGAILHTALGLWAQFIATCLDDLSCWLSY